VSAANLCVTFSASVLVFWYGGWAVLDDADAQLTVGSLVTFNLYWVMLQTAVKQMNNMLNIFIVSASAGKRVLEVIDLEPDIKLDNPTAVSLKPGMPTIKFYGVCFTYQMRPEKAILTGLSFTLPPSKTTALVGKSGAGKTTVINLLLRFYDPQVGAILVDGEPLTSYELRAWHRRIGIVSQETQIFARSVYDNLTYGLKDGEYTSDTVIAAAKAANAHDFIMEADSGYNYILGESGGRLSGGQKQRISIARAILRKPQILLLDEATSSLDSENEQQIQLAIDDMVRSMVGCTVVLIAHRLSTVKNADKIIVMSDGCVCEEGTHEELLCRDNLYARLVKRQLAKEAQRLPEDTVDDGFDVLMGESSGTMATGLDTKKRKGQHWSGKGSGNERESGSKGKGKGSYVC